MMGMRKRRGMRRIGGRDEREDMRDVGIDFSKLLIWLVVWFG